MFQSFGLIASLRAGENVALPLALAGVPEARARGPSARRPSRRSGSDQRSRPASTSCPAASASASASPGRSSSSRRMILADEPTGSLDEENAGGVLGLLADAVRRRGASLVLVTHDPASAARADRRYRMRDGRLTRGRPA